MPVMTDRRLFGTVTAIDRANGVVRALLDPYDSTTEEVVVPYNPQRMPWPFARAVFRESSRGVRCVGPIGHRRVLFHDDFLSTGAVSLVGSPAASRGTGLGLGVLSAAYTGSTVMLATNEDAILLEEDWAIHFRVRFAISSPVGDPVFVMGRSLNLTTFANPTLTVTAAAGEQFALGGTDEYGNTPIDGTAYADDTFFDAEMLMTYEGGNYGWVDGNGPSRSTVNFSSVPSALVAGMNLGTSATLLIDEWSAALVSQTNTPTQP